MQQTMAYVVKVAGNVVGIFHEAAEGSFERAVLKATELGVGNASELKNANANNIPFNGAAVWYGPVDVIEFNGDCSNEVRRALTTIEIGVATADLAWILGHPYGWRAADPEFNDQPHPTN